MTNWVDKLMFMLRNKWMYDDDALEQWCDEAFERQQEMMK
jgi:hypothetical protein